MRYGLVVAAAIALLGSGAARADDLIRRGGEWRTVVTGVGPTPQTIDMCFGPATMADAMAKLAARPGCSKTSITRSGDHLTLDIACGSMTMQGTVVVSGDTAYHADLTMIMGAGGSAKTIHSLSDAQWIGACKPGETPR